MSKNQMVDWNEIRTVVGDNLIDIGKYFVMGGLAISPKNPQQILMEKLMKAQGVDPDNQSNGVGSLAPGGPLGGGDLGDAQQFQDVFGGLDKSPPEENPDDTNPQDFDSFIEDLRENDSTRLDRSDDFRDDDDSGAPTSG